MGQTFCQFVKHMDAMQHTLAQLNKKFLLPSPTFTPQDREEQGPTNQALTAVDHTADGQYDPAGNENIPAGPVEFTPSSVHDKTQGHEGRDRLAYLFAGDEVEDSWYPATIRGRAISYPQPLTGPEPMTGMAPSRPLPLPTSPGVQSFSAVVKAEQTKTTVQDKPKGRSHSAPITRRPRSLSWYEILGYESEPVPGPITWEESAEDDVCIEGTGPFWSGKEVSIEGYTDGRCASLFTSTGRRERCVIWETELKVFQQAHELEQAKREVARLKERIKDLQAAGRIYRDELIMATQDIEYVEEQWRRDKSDLVAARGYIERLETRWGKDHAELLIARDYITELEKTEVQCECWRKRKWEPEVPASTKKAKANQEGNARRKSYNDFWTAQESRRSDLFFLAL
ncbi:hypothetical protein BDW72DRAFT_69933 [Aspergillus terricola var. indicus]